MKRSVKTVKKIVFFWLAALMLALFTIASAEGAEATLLVYMCGTDLQDYACEDLVEMAEAEAGEALNVVVLAGGANSWDLEDLQGGSRTLAVIRDGYFEELQDWGRGSMGSPESLEAFLNYGFTEYPAERMMVVLWDHGAGSEGGVCFDETAGDDGLTLVEIQQALHQVQQAVPDFHIQIFGCDACMMASYEMASMLAEFPIDYYVASEELEPGSGWFYTDWLELLRDDPAITDRELCEAIVESYITAGLQEDPDDYLTLSAVELSGMRELKRCMEQFAGVITGQISGDGLTSVRRGRSRMYTFGSFADASWDMVDLGAVLDAYAQFDPALAGEARRLLSSAVVCASQTDNLDPCCGLSILLPQDTASSFDKYRDGINLSGVIPNWVEFVNGYVSLLVNGHHSFSASGVSPLSADEEPEGLFSSVYDSPSALAWDDETESYDAAAAAEEIAIQEDAQGFAAVLPPEDLGYLDYVEGMLLMDISEDGKEGYVDFGTLRNNLVNWNSGKIVSLYDGTWPVFGGQPVPLYDQSSNEHSRRSLLPVKLNGEYTYLVVIFPAGGTEGRIVGANAGYDENGLPIRSVTRLSPGDEIIPVYTMFYEEEGMEELQETEFEGEPIRWEEGMTVAYEDLSDEDDPVEMLFCFIFNDIFGDYTMSEMVSFEL